MTGGAGGDPVPVRIASVPLRGARATLFVHPADEGPSDETDRARARRRAAAWILDRASPSDLPLLLIPEPRSGQLEIILPERRPDGSPGLSRATVPAPHPIGTRSSRRGSPPLSLPDALVARPGEDASAVASRRKKALDPAVPARRLMAALKGLAREVPAATILAEVTDAMRRDARGEPPTASGPVAEVLARFRLSGTESTVEDRSRDPDPEFLGSLLWALRADGERTSRGAFYTPRWVARHLARCALDGYLEERAGAGASELASIREAAWEEPRRRVSPGTSARGRRIERALEALRVCDPAAGTGSLLVALLQEIVLLREGIARWRGESPGPGDRAAWRRWIVSRSLHGIDADPGALAVCAARLSIMAGDAPARLLCADVLGEGPGGRARRDLTGLPADFDAVIANPPYVRQERIGGAAKRSLGLRFPEVFRPKSDLHVFFCARAAELARPGGHLALVTNGKFLKAGYGEGLRDHFARSLTIRSLYDLGAHPVFRAAAYPVLLSARRAPPPPGHRMAVADLGAALDASAGRRDAAGAIEAAVARAKPRRIAQRRLDARGWSLEGGSGAHLERRWERTARPLGEFVGGRMVRGIVTGLNEAFVIDGATREALLAEEPRTAEILFAWGRGRDVHPWRMAPSGLWVLFTRRGIDLARYPGARAHLERFRDRLTPREIAGPGPGRKPGHYRWYEIQDRIAYADAFSGPKIVFSKFVTAPRFAWDESGAMTSNATGILPGAPAWLVAILQSDCLWPVLRRRLTRLQNGYWQLMNANLLALPILEPSPGDREALGAIAKRLASGAARAEEERALAARAEGIVRGVYGVGDPPRRPGRPDPSRVVDPAPEAF